MEMMSGEDLINSFEDDIGTVYFSSLIKTEESFRSNILLLVGQQDGFGLFDMISGNPSGTSSEIDNDLILAVGEINNILGSAFINNMANRLKQEIHPSTPMNSYDMLGAILQGAIIQEELVGKKILVADTVFSEKGKNEFHARMFIMTDAEDFIRLMG
jgi:chemotaxis protein CheC